MKVTLPVEYNPGAELGYAEITADFTTTSVNFSGPVPDVGSLLSALGLTITGMGRPVDVCLTLPFVRHSTANGAVYLQLATKVNAGAQQIATAPRGRIFSHSSPSNSTGRGVSWLSRLGPIPVGEVWLLTPCITAGTAGTVTVNANEAWPGSMSVTLR